MPKGVAWPPIQQTGLPSAWRTQWLLPTPGGPKIISRFRCASAKARTYCSSSAKVATRTACGGGLCGLDMLRTPCSLPHQAVVVGPILPRRSVGRAALTVRAGELPRGPRQIQENLPGELKSFGAVALRRGRVIGKRRELEGITARSSFGEQGSMKKVWES